MRTERGGGVSSPPFSFTYSGTCIVAGSAFCLHEDLEKAKKILGDVPVIAVNGASREVKALMLVSQHPENFTARGAEWVRHQRRLFGDGFTVHSTKKLPIVDYVWNLTHRGGSAWIARRIAGLVGFEPVVLVGCPLVTGNYSGYRPGILMTKPVVVNQLLKQIAEDAEWLEGCYSMSGATRELLGCP